MSLIRNLIFLLMLFVTYYAGYREWGTDVLLGWFDNTEFSEFILESGSGLWGWVQDQELGDQVEQGLDRVKDAVSQ